MPVEFSVAAYRFGHTLVRSQYPVNAGYPVIDLFDERFGTEGFSPVPEKLTVDWRFLLDVDPCVDFVRSKAFDHLLADELIRMPDPVVGRFASDNDRSLAFRNLLRSFVLGLPSGQAVADELRAKGYKIPDCDLEFDKLPRWNCLDKGQRKKLAEHTPLFLFLLVESGQVGQGMKLGPTASAILLEVFLTMLKHCESILNLPEEHPTWQPDSCVAGEDGLTLADIARYIEA